MKDKKEVYQFRSRENNKREINDISEKIESNESGQKELNVKKPKIQSNDEIKKNECKIKIFFLQKS